jgi:hypothetical protein
MGQAYWWEQVGPRRFYLEVFQALKLNSVVAWFPAHTTENILVSLDEYWPSLAATIHHLDADEDETPENLIRDELPQAIGVENLFSLLCGVRDLLVVKHVSKEAWPGWSRFIDGYHRHVSAGKLRVADVSRFLVLATAVKAELARSGVVTVKHFPYEGFISLSDTERYCQRMLAGNGQSLVQRQVAASVIAHLALWDKEIADRLCEKPLSDILAPTRVLRSVALARKWKPESEIGWHAGTENEIDDEKCCSSALLALRGDGNELNQRIWRAQLKVLFPFIEQRRNLFIDIVRDYFPFLPPEINLADTEFAKLGHHIRENTPIGEQERYGVFLQIVNAFGTVRNELAHRSPASAESLQAMFGAVESMDNLVKYGFSPQL